MTQLTLNSPTKSYIISFVTFIRQGNISGLHIFLTTLMGLIRRAITYNVRRSQRKILMFESQDPIMLEKSFGHPLIKSILL